MEEEEGGKVKPEFLHPTGILVLGTVCLTGFEVGGWSLVLDLT